VKAVEKKKQLLICQHCGHVWTYKGSKRYTACPSCHYNVKNLFFLEQQTNLVHFNLHEEGIRLLDPTLATKFSPHGRIIDVQFRDGKAYCQYDDSFDCRHVQFALNLPLVKRIFKKKGWG